MGMERGWKVGNGEVELAARMTWWGWKGVGR